MFGVVSTTYSFATVMAWWQTQVEEVSSVSSSSLLALAEEMSSVTALLFLCSAY